MRRTTWTLPLIVVALSAPAIAHAQQAAADALFDSARASMAKGDLNAACEQFRASDKLDPAAGTELNLAECEEKRGHLASAWELYRTAAEQLAEKDERLALARSRAQALEPRVPKLTLSLAAGAPQGTTVHEGSIELGSAAFGVALPLELGAHELVVSAAGFEPRTFRFSLAEGEVKALIVEPGSAVRANAPATATVAPKPAPHDEVAHGSSTRTLGFALGGVGVAGLGVGAIAGLLELSKKHAVDDGCQPDKSCTSAGLAAARSGRTLETVSNVGWVVGAAALGAGVYFLLTSGPSSKPTTSVSLSTSPSGGQLSVKRSF
jgi:hypothetical protein